MLGQIYYFAAAAAALLRQRPGKNFNIGIGQVPAVGTQIASDLFRGGPKKRLTVGFGCRQR
jgi:hypothetical protein